MKSIRRKKILYDYCGDGRYPDDRIKGFWKRYWRKWIMRNYYREI